MRSIDTINYHIKHQCNNLQSLKKADKTLTRMKDEAVFPPIIQTLGNWHFEHSSLGFRCLKCGTWINLNQTKPCDCDMKETIKMLRQDYKAVIVDIDSSTFSKTVKAYSFEDALFRIRGMYRGYGIKSIEINPC